jgi:hypothetical protein
MLSAAAAALLAAVAGVSAARADTEVNTAQTTALTTSTAGNITIDSGSGISLGTASAAAVTLNSNNFVLNNGYISNPGVDSAIGLEIDTTNGNLFPPATGVASTGSFDLTGNGTAKRGIFITGGNTFYGPITLTSLTATSTTGTTGAAQASGMSVKGDSSFGLYLAQGTTVTSNIFTGGNGISYSASDNSTQSNAVIIDLDGKLNGNYVNAGAINAVGPGVVGIFIAGGISSCASDTNAPSGFSCPASSGGTFVNEGNISLAGTAILNTRGTNLEAGTAVIIANSIAGGFINEGPGTASSVTSTSITSAGLIGNGVVQPVVLIDPSRSITSTLQTTPRSPIIMGPVTSDVDASDPGYSFINRGTILASPTDAQLSTGAVVIQGNSSTYTTCLSAAVNACSGLNSNPANNSGGLLDTGTISARATTNSQLNTSSGTVSASALYIGAFAIVPRIDVKAETVSGTTTTPGTITALVQGIGQGSAFGLTIGANANVPEVDVGKGAQIIAGVSTSTVSPDKFIAPSTAPFTLVSEALVDQSGTLTLINNAGSIQAVNTTLTPQSGASVFSFQRAIDLQQSTASNIVVNNSGKIIGDLLFGSSGNGDTLNVGNTGGTLTSPTANPGTGVINSPTNYAVVAESIISQTSGFAPVTNAGLIDFGSGTNQTLHVGGYGYVNAVINSGVGALNVQVDSNGQLFVANTTTSLQANNFVVNSNGTLGLSISQANVNSLTPVVQANSATLSGANLALVFGTYVTAGNTANAVANPSEQTITLVRATTLTDTTLADQNALLGQNTPFLFESPTGSNAIPASSGYAPDKGPTPLSINSSGAQQSLILHLLPRSVNATNADGSPGLNLSGDAKNQFPFVSQALSTDNQLGAAVATSMTVYNTPGLASSGINVAASQQQAQRLFSQFSPDVSGGTREIAVMLTDQATGPIAARQRLLRSYGTVAGDMTLWGEEFAAHINNKGRPNGANDLTSYKDHGFGFAVGVDGGSPRNGWYGGAFTFYSGDVSQLLPRATKTQTEWYMLTGYTDWRGKHLFLDTHLDVAYGNFQETRTLTVGSLVRTATSKRPGAMLAMGANAGVVLNKLGMEITPHVSLDGMTLREEGYTEGGGGTGFNLAVAPYFASSLRGAFGTDIKGDIKLFGFDFTPEARAGYRYDMLHQAVKIRAAFDATGGLGTTGNTMTFIGPDPDTGNVFTGLSLGAGTEDWKLGVNYDWVRGNNGSTTQVGTLTVLGRI